MHCLRGKQQKYFSATEEEGSRAPEKFGFLKICSRGPKTSGEPGSECFPVFLTNVFMSLSSSRIFASIKIYKIELIKIMPCRVSGILNVGYIEVRKYYRWISGVLIAGLICCYSSIIISTLRFFARPSFVELSNFGFSKLRPR